MIPRFEFGEEVRVTRNIRNDGTFPGQPTGALLARCGSTGHVRDVGTFLQDQLVYTIHFVDDGQLVGCREEELIPASDPWVDSRFQRRDTVVAERSLAVSGTVVAPAGTSGEVVDVLRFEPDGVAYHVRFPGHTLRVPEGALGAPEDAMDATEAPS